MPLPLDELVNQPVLVNQRAQELDWEELLFEYELALDDIQAWLRGFNEEQIHFKPGEKVFSIAEIVSHSVLGDELCWSWLLLLAQGRGAEIDPQALVGGAGARQTASLLELAALNEACRTLARNTIATLPAAADLAAAAPHPYFGRLNAKGWLYFMCVHRGMHRNQCESVIDTPGFPHSVSVQTQPRAAYQPSDRKAWLEPGAESKSTGALRGKQKAKGKPTGTLRGKQGAKGKAVKKQTVSKKKTARSK